MQPVSTSLTNPFPPKKNPTNLLSITLDWFVSTFYVYLSMIIFEAHPWCCIHQPFVPFHSERVFHCIVMPPFPYPFTYCHTFELFPVGAITYRAVMNKYDKFLHRYTYLILCINAWE